MFDTSNQRSFILVLVEGIVKSKTSHQGFH
jgi:hypothetical protein